jgi:hypothetical protein
MEHLTAKRCRKERTLNLLDGAMRRALKIGAWCVGIMMLLFGLVAWRSIFFYPKAWRARITVDERGCDGCAVYLSTSRIGGVLVRRDGAKAVSYSVAFPNPDLDVPNGAVWKCVEGAYFFVPGVALHSPHQWCAPWGTTNAQKRVAMDSRSLAFTADDGKRVRAEW